MSIITVNKLSKIFKSYKKAPGVWGSLKGLFKRETITVEAVKHISFTINEGEFVGFVGPNGAGKTTTLKMLSGILYPSGGDVRVLGFIPWKREPQFQRQFSLVMGQKNQLWWDLPAIETFLLHKAIYEIPEKRYKKTIHELTDLLDVSDLVNVQVRKLSLGERMKCELIAALLHEPKILFLDEPTIGLDVVSQRNIRDFLREYNQTKKTTIILTSHYMEDIRRLCGRVMIIDHGNIIYDNTYNNLIDTYAIEKTIEITTTAPLDAHALERFGRVHAYTDFSAKIYVPRKDVAIVTNELLQHFTIDDISIHEETMEKIVADIFENKRTPAY